MDSKPILCQRCLARVKPEWVSRSLSRSWFTPSTAGGPPRAGKLSPAALSPHSGGRNNFCLPQNPRKILEFNFASCFIIVWTLLKMGKETKNAWSMRRKAPRVCTAMALFYFYFSCSWAGTAASPRCPASQPLAHAACCFSPDENINQRGVKSAIFLLSGSAAAVCECRAPNACLLLLSQQMQDGSLIAGYKQTSSAPCRNDSNETGPWGLGVWIL